MRGSLYLLISLITLACACKTQSKIPSAYVGEGYVVTDSIFGDLNHDGLEDCVLIVKGTSKENIVLNRSNLVVDKNRKGLVILFNINGGYSIALENYTCFDSDNEDGGVYYPPELKFDINDNQLFLHYNHGRYGYWSYTFQFQNSNFELIEYEAVTFVALITEKETHLNFLTKQKLISKNINNEAEGNDEVFKDTWSTIEINKLINLADIPSFYDLDMYQY